MFGLIKWTLEHLDLDYIFGITIDHFWLNINSYLFFHLRYFLLPRINFLYNFNLRVLHYALDISLYLFPIDLYCMYFLCYHFLDPFFDNQFSNLPFLVEQYFILIKLCPCNLILDEFWRIRYLAKKIRKKDIIWNVEELKIGNKVSTKGKS